MKIRWLFFPAGWSVRARPSPSPSLPREGLLSNQSESVSHRPLDHRTRSIDSIAADAIREGDEAQVPLRTPRRAGHSEVLAVGAGAGAGPGAPIYRAPCPLPFPLSVVIAAARSASDASPHPFHWHSVCRGVRAPFVAHCKKCYVKSTGT